MFETQNKEKVGTPLVRFVVKAWASPFRQQAPEFFGVKTVGCLGKQQIRHGNSDRGHVN